jgi:ADP-dependent NAD(P)H-hydrate dehydratase / NAD(P)H-hydrate epimerase
MPVKLVTAAEMQAIEARGVALGGSTPDFMLNAGTSVFSAITAQNGFDPDDQSNRLNNGLALVVAGPGNNGGDAMVVADLLKEAYPSAEVKIYFHKRSRPTDPQGFNTRLTYTEAEDQDGHDLSYPASFAAFEADLLEAALLVDGVLGAGITRPVTGETAHIIETINLAAERRKFEPDPLFVVAIDVPSGINTDTGEVMDVAIRANLTVCLGYPKIGLFNNKALLNTGKVVMGDIGLPLELYQEVEALDKPALITAEFVRYHLPPRPLTGHKGTFGKVMVVSGADEYLGAPFLCTSAAMRAGAGLVTLAVPRPLIPVMASKMSENTFLPLPEENSEESFKLISDKLEGYQALLVGPGIGQKGDKVELIQKFLENGQSLPPLVLDADALNILAYIPNWWDKLKPDNILTPHPMELARLSNLAVAVIEGDRLKSALNFAQVSKQIVILKGAYTVIAAPDGRVRVNPAANPAMATAGSGDVLAGICAGLLAQFSRSANADPFEVACVGVYLHAMTGELMRRDFGEAGVLAGDFLQAIPQAINAIKTGDGLE